MALIPIIAKRLAALAVVLLAVSVMTFTIAYLMPGDPAQMISGPRASAEQVAELRHRLQLDRPLHVQYTAYLRRLSHGDLGTSTQTGRPVNSELLSRVPATLELMSLALFVSFVAGVLLGIVAALSHGGVWDQLIRIVSVLGISLPMFWLGLLLLLVFYAQLGWLPPGGRLDPSLIPPANFTGIYWIDALVSGQPSLALDAFKHLVLPVATLSSVSMGVYIRLMRASMLEVLGEDYIRTARAHGLRMRSVVFRHALRNALIPMVTVLGIELGHLLFGSVVVETIFAWPGMGSYALGAIYGLDFPVIMGFTILTSIAYVGVNLVVDLIYLSINPRLRGIG